MKRIKETAMLLGVCFVLVGLFSPRLWAQNDSIAVSVITAGPSDEAVYTLYGHTAVRVQNYSRGTDEVYNYGLFSFQQPHFLSNFVKGKPVYFVDKEPFDLFYQAYVQNGRSLREQRLRLDKRQSADLLAALEENILPENRDYRYNFIFANCANIPMLLIDRVCGGIRIAPLENRWTYRQWLASCTQNDPWQTFGTNLALGYHADRLPKTLGEMFLPKMVYDCLQTAEWQKNQQPVVAETKLLYASNDEQREVQKKPFLVRLLDPELVLALLLFLYLIVLTHAWRTNKVWALMCTETFILLLAGLSGCLLWFIGFVSEHPFTWPNLNLMLLHPFYLILMVLLWIKPMRNVNILLHLLTFVILILYFVLMLLDAQALTPGVYWVFLTLATLSGKHSLAQYMQRRKERKIAKREARQ